MGGVDVADPGNDRLLQEGDVLGRHGQPVRPEPDPGHLAITQTQLRFHGFLRFASTDARLEMMAVAL